jgi:hypothetical protein
MLIARRRSGSESRNDGTQKFRAVARRQAVSRTLPAIRATPRRPAANSAATATSSPAPILKACRRRAGLGGSGVRASREPEAYTEPPTFLRAEVIALDGEIACHPVAQSASGVRPIRHRLLGFPHCSVQSKTLRFRGGKLRPGCGRVIRRSPDIPQRSTDRRGQRPGRRGARARWRTGSRPRGWTRRSSCRCARCAFRPSSA